MQNLKNIRNSYHNSRTYRRTSLDTESVLHEDMFLDRWPLYVLVQYMHQNLACSINTEYHGSEISCFGISEHTLQWNYDWLTTQICAVKLQIISTNLAGK